jgi:hypothetical protein
MGRSGGKEGTSQCQSTFLPFQRIPAFLPERSAGGQTRTVDPALMRRVLSPTELLRQEPLIVTRGPVTDGVAHSVCSRSVRL